jgi:DNA-binding transcriptional MerR regulator
VSEGFKIGELSARCGISRDTIRFYERSGLLPRPRRTASGHRLYDERSAHLVMLIRHAQALGLALQDIRQLLALRDFRAPASMRRVTEILTARLRALEHRIEQFEQFRGRLASALARSTGSHPAPLPVILGVPDTSRSRRKER